MPLQRIKMIVSTALVVVSVALGIAAPVTWPVQLAIAALGFVPALALLLWWKEPAQTMTESINEIRQGR